MKKVLILTYYWPPSGGPGVQRWLKFARYLPLFGFEPVVVTVDPEQATYPVADDSLMEEVPPHLQLHYTPTREPYAIYRKLFRKKQIPYSGFANEEKSGLLSGLSRFIRGNFFVPDARVGWNRYAIAKARKLIVEQGIEVLVTTSPPHSTQLAGLQLKKEFPNLHWVADLRDPWTEIFYYDKMLHLPPVKRKDRKLERMVLMHADRVITVSDFIRQMFVKTVGEIHADRFNVIPNGFDSEDFESTPPRYQNTRFTIGYVGTLAESYRLSGFIRAVEAFQPQSEKEVKIHFTGQICEKWEKQLGEHLGEMIEISGHVSHKRAIERMQASDVLLLVIPDTAQNHGILTGKLFEYMASGRVILGIGPPGGDAARILKETASGEVFHYDDHAGMVAFLHRLMSHNYVPDRSAIAKYSRKNLTEYLTSLLKH